MTYTLFTLFPILLFALVTLWKLKLNYDTDIYQLQTRLTKATTELNKSSSLSLALDRKVKEEEKENKQLKEDNSLMNNKTETLKERMKVVEARALNLTSKLLIKEMDLGLLKKEKIRLEQQVKEKAAPTLKGKVGGGKKEKLINLATLAVVEKKEPTLNLPLNNSVEEAASSSAEKTDVKEKLVDKLMDIKKKQTELETDKEQIIQKAEKVDKDTDKEEIVDKLVDIKKKQQELEEAKKDFFSDTDDSDDSEQVENANGVTKNDTVGLVSKKSDIAMNVDQDDIQSLIKLPESSNQTQQQVLPTASTAAVGSPSVPLSPPASVPQTAPPLLLKLAADPSSNGTPVVVGNTSFGTNATLDDEKKIHIILDVKNGEDVLNKQ